MKKINSSFVLCSLAASLMLPYAAFSSEQELEKKIDALNAEVNSLKAKNERSLDSWLTVGGDFRFRVDSLGGETASYIDAMGTLANAGTLTGPAATAFQGFAGAMPTTTTYAAAKQLVDGAMAGGMQTILGSIAKQVPGYKPKNDTLYTNRVGLDFHAKATKDVTFNGRLVSYKVFGANDDSAVTNGGNTPFFADRVGVLEEIVTNVKQVTHLVNEIGQASFEQSNGITEITKAVAQLDQVTQENTSSSQVSAVAAQELTGQTQSLEASVQLLVASIKGNTN